MIRFLVKRLLQGFLVLLGVVVVVFYIFQVLPGDPTAMMLGQRADVASQESIRKELGLDESISMQLIHYLNDLSPISIHKNTLENQEKYQYSTLFSMGNDNVVTKSPYLRRSYQSNRPVGEILWVGFKGTMWLALAAIVFATIIGITMGIWAALQHKTWVDHSLVFFSVIGISAPSFVAATLIAYLFAIVLKNYTGLNLTGHLYEYDAFEGRQLVLKNLILPAITLGIRPLAIITQLTRSSMLDVMGQDYIRTARAKGLSEQMVVWKHALRNALNPVVTAISGWLASLLAGAFFVEYIFDWKGLGSVTIGAVFALDLPVVMGSTIVISLVFILVNILVDILYSLIDPRVRL